MLFLLQILGMLSVVAAAFICTYHIVLATVALCTWGRGERRSDSPCHTFAIVIPAHNEEHTVQLALDACSRLDYARDKMTVYVLADNCTDQTAEISRQHGAVCLARHDTERNGKGFALEWALPRVLADGRDAVLILDADCTIDAHALRVFDQCLKAGDKVLQTNFIVANPDDSAISYVLAVGGFVANVLFHAPKSVLGMPILLIGSGMVLHREILLRFPWRAQSLCEDTEYSLLLHEYGIRSRFVSSVCVTSDSPVNRQQMAVQRRRWIRGEMHAAWRHGLRLIWKGLKNRRIGLVDAGFTSAIVSRPLVLAQLFLTVLLALLCQWLAPSAVSNGVVLIVGTVIAMYALYAATGVCLFGLNARRICFLLQSPLVILEYFTIAATAMLRFRSGNWDRTPRVEPPRET